MKRKYEADRNGPPRTLYAYLIAGMAFYFLIFIDTKQRHRHNTYRAADKKSAKKPDKKHKIPP